MTVVCNYTLFHIHRQLTRIEKIMKLLFFMFPIIEFESDPPLFLKSMAFFCNN